jgi:glycosyltransferase involved in cell wall biosynthesis
MRILHIVPTNSKSEIPIFVSKQLEYLQYHGVKNDVFGFQGTKLSLKHPIRLVLSLRELCKIIKVNKSEVIHAHWGSILGFITTLFTSKSKKSILTLRGSDLNRNAFDSIVSNIFRQLFTLVSALFANHIIVMNEQMKGKLFYVKHKVTVLPDGTPNDIFYPRDRYRTKKELDLDLNKKYVIFYRGNRPKTKNLELALKIFAKIKVEIENTEIIVLDNDKSQNEVAKLLSASDLLLFTSLNEGSPNIVREAIACGCPVVSRKVADVAKWIEKSGAGAVIEDDDSLMAEVSIRIIKKSLRSNPNAIKEVTSGIVNLKLVEIYRQLLNNLEINSE